MIDLALASYLIFILPGRQLWRSVRPSAGPKCTAVQRYVSGIRSIGLLLGVLMLVCWYQGHRAADLGLAPPSSGLALWSLIAALVGMLALLVSGIPRLRKMAPAKRATEIQRARAGGMPTEPAEMRLFLILTLFIGVGWELLYRGFLLLALAPYIGPWGAVAVSGVAYGAAHGYRSPSQIALSIGTALLFAAGYLLTGSLWWLIVIHVLLPLTTALNTWLLIKREATAQAAGRDGVAARSDI